MIVCVAANPSIDKLFEVERLTPGAIHRPLGFVQVAGGKGLNAARAAAALGAEVRVAAILGGHAGRWVAEELERHGIALEPVWVGGETRSSLSVADRSGAGLTEFYERGAEVTAAAWDELAAVSRRLSAGAAWLTVSGSLPPGVPADGYRRLTPICPCAADTHAIPPDGAAIVKLNAVEAAAATGVDTSTVEGALAAAERLCGRPGGAGAVTRGGDGAVLISSGGDALVGTLAAPGRYPVGSGDAFLAGLVVARERGAGWDEALRLALGAGAANAAVPGAGVFQRSDAERLAARATVS